MASFISKLKKAAAAAEADTAFTSNRTEKNDNDDDDDDDDLSPSPPCSALSSKKEEALLACDNGIKCSPIEDFPSLSLIFFKTLSLSSAFILCFAINSSIKDSLILTNFFFGVIFSFSPSVFLILS